MTTTRVVRIGTAMAMAAVLLAGCGGSSDAPSTDTTSTTEAAVTTTEDAVTTTTAAGEVTTTTAGSSSTEPSNGLEPGDPCSMEEGSPDCIDPDGDGEGTYLIGGADCIATAPDPAICTDLDGDGLAGYPDSN